MKVHLLLVHLSVFTCCAMAGHKGYEEPPYKVITHPEPLEFEERLYEGGQKWVCTDNTDGSTRRQMFWRLYGYINGGNSEKKTIPMTCPVKTKVDKPTSGDYDSGSEGKRTMCFYLGKDHQENPPKPNDEKVFIETKAEFSVFTRKLGGWMRESDWQKERQVLANMVTKAGMSFESSYFYACGYDSPFMLFNRRNEAWLVKEDKNDD